MASMEKELNNQILKLLTNYDNVLWDWNGTLIDDVDIAVSCINKLLPKYGLARITAEKYRNIFDFPVKKYYENLGLDLTKFSFEEIRDQYIIDYNANVAKESSLFPGTLSLLSEIKKSKNQYILSAVSQWHLDEMTSHFKLDSFFDKRFGVNNHYASSKLERGNELMEIAKIPKGRTILIGDTIHDFEVASKLEIDCLIIADGHQSFERLQSTTSNIIFGRREFR